MNPLLLLCLVVVIAAGGYYAVSPASSFGGDEAKALYDWFNSAISDFMAFPNDIFGFFKNNVWNSLQSLYDGFIKKLKTFVFDWIADYLTRYASAVGVALGLDFDGDNCFNPVEDFTALIQGVAGSAPDHSNEVGGTIDDPYPTFTPDYEGEWPSYPYSVIVPAFSPAAYYDLWIHHQDGNEYHITVVGADYVAVYGNYGWYYEKIRGTSGDTVTVHAVGDKMRKAWFLVVKAEFDDSRDNTTTVMMVRREVINWG